MPIQDIQLTPARLAIFLVAAALVGAVGGHAIPSGALSSLSPPAASAASTHVRHFNLTIEPKDIPMGGGAVWHAWTYNGTVPGPTLTATVGDLIEVTVKNTMNITHSFHTHLSPYSLPNDGSQLNTITGIGGMAMIPPGGSYTYSYVATVPGIFYYHCHSADGGHSIHQHIAQGLYGAIIIRAAEEPPINDQVVFMAETGFDTTNSAPYYIMNGHGMPGGEAALMMAFHENGIDGVKAALGTVVPILHGKVGVPMRISVINIGDMEHSFHIHGMMMYSVDKYPGRPVPAQVLGLIPGEADRIMVTPTEPGLWLYHCHVVSHADGGMIGVFIVDPEA